MERLTITPQAITGKLARFEQTTKRLLQIAGNYTSSSQVEFRLLEHTLPRVEAVLPDKIKRLKLAADAAANIEALQQLYQSSPTLDPRLLINAQETFYQLVTPVYPTTNRRLQPITAERKPTTEKPEPEDKQEQPFLNTTDLAVICRAIVNRTDPAKKPKFIIQEELLNQVEATLPATDSLEKVAEKQSEIAEYLFDKLTKHGDEILTLVDSLTVSKQPEDQLLLQLLTYLVDSYGQTQILKDTMSAGKKIDDLIDQVGFFVGIVPETITTPICQRQSGEQIVTPATDKTTIEDKKSAQRINRLTQLHKSIDIIIDTAIAEILQRNIPGRLSADGTISVGLVRDIMGGLKFDFILGCIDERYITVIGSPSAPRVSLDGVVMLRVIKDLATGLKRSQLKTLQKEVDYRLTQAKLDL